MGELIMEQDRPTQKDLALLLFAAERTGSSGADEVQKAAQRTFEKLSLHLSRRLGSRGYHSLLKRAVTLATTDFPWLASVHITEAGIPEDLHPVMVRQTVLETTDGCVAILAGLIGLLDIFIGRDLCLRVLGSAWPDAIRIDKRSQGDSNG